jgi:hypothetical protein
MWMDRTSGHHVTATKKGGRGAKCTSRLIVLLVGPQSRGGMSSETPHSSIPVFGDSVRRLALSFQHPPRALLAAATICAARRDEVGEREASA